MTMKSILRNWKTTLIGVAVIVVNLFTAKGKMDAQIGTAIAAGLGLIAAKDHDKIGTGDE